VKCIHYKLAPFIKKIIIGYEPEAEKYIPTFETFLKNQLTTLDPDLDDKEIVYIPLPAQNDSIIINEIRDSSLLNNMLILGSAPIIFTNSKIFDSETNRQTHGYNPFISINSLENGFLWEENKITEDEAIQLVNYAGWHELCHTITGKEDHIKGNNPCTLGYLTTKDRLGTKTRNEMLELLSVLESPQLCPECIKGYKKTKKYGHPVLISETRNPKENRIAKLADYLN